MLICEIMVAIPAAPSPRRLLPPDPDTWLSIEQACALVGVTRRTLYNWLQAGKIDAASVRRTVGGAVRIRAGALWQSESDK